MNDDAGTGRWMTYDELAAMRGIKRIGAVRLVQRYKWRRQAGNDGRARVLVPHDALEKVRGTDAGISAPAYVTPTNAGTGGGTDTGNGAGSDAPAMQARGLAGLEDAIAALREAKDSEIATLHVVIDGLRASIARAENRAGLAETDRNAAVADLRSAITLADQSVTLLVDAAARADHAEAAVTGERARADGLRDRVDILQAAVVATETLLGQARAEALAALDVADALRRAEDERKGRGVLARLRAAWRGE